VDGSYCTPSMSAEPWPDPAQALAEVAGHLQQEIRMAPE
jgi:hypothetical protein